MNSEGEHIKILRKSIGMSQREFADHLGISVRTIQDWEVGRRVPPSYVPRLLAYRVEYERVCKSQKVLIAYFANTSAEMLVSGLAFDSVSLPSDKEKDIEILLSEMQKKEYEYIICVGQKPGLVDSVRIETEAHGERTLHSQFDCKHFSEILRENGVQAALSSKPGNSFCNNIFYASLEYIAEHNKTSKMCFLHVPYSDKISDVDMFHERLEASIRQVIFANI